MIDTLKKYNKAGYACLPTKADKSPDVKGTWKGGVDNEFDYQGVNGIGIICGELSGNLECWDFDNHFGDAKETLSSFIADIKDLYEKYKFPIESTLTGGYHLLLKCEHIEGNKKLASKPKQDNGKWRPDAIIETRGEGGYFVAAPSPGYRVIKNDILNVPVITKQERKVMLEVARSFNMWNEIIPTDFENRDRPGDVFNTKLEAIDQMRGSLVRAGWNEISDGKWRRPGKKEGISATLGKVAPNVFYCFTSNGHPFESGSGYTPFQVISLLDHNGNFSEFAKELSDRYEMAKPEINKQKPETKQPDEYERIIAEAFIDLEIPIEKPPVIMRVRNHYVGFNDDTRLFTLGNFSAITGKSKSKKTFLSSLILTAAAGNSIVQDKFVATFPDNKRAILLFDTEQSRYDAYKSALRIPTMLGYSPENFGTFDLREYEPLERCNIIEYALKKYADYLGLVVIDGIADLAKAINDEEEATRVVGLLMKWTKIYNCHIVTVIHQNKNDSYATGHIGSAILKKSECVISVEKNETEPNQSEVKCNLIRGAKDFNDFSIRINENGLPEVIKSTYNKSEKDVF